MSNSHQYSSQAWLNNQSCVKAEGVQNAEMKKCPAKVAVAPIQLIFDATRPLFHLD